MSALEKAFQESLHPRDPEGRFRGKGSFEQAFSIDSLDAIDGPDAFEQALNADAPEFPEPTHHGNLRGKEADAYRDFLNPQTYAEVQMDLRHPDEITERSKKLYPDAKFERTKGEILNEAIKSKGKSRKGKTVWRVVGAKYVPPVGKPVKVKGVLAVGPQFAAEIIGPQTQSEPRLIKLKVVGDTPALNNEESDPEWENQSLFGEVIPEYDFPNDTRIVIDKIHEPGDNPPTPDEYGEYNENFLGLPWYEGRIL